MTTDEMMRRRRSVMSPGLRLSYARPVHVSSASGVWITEVDGTRLLDAYNNVPHVGHSRPEVVDAIASQAARLNTNTRYVADIVVEYAERLASLFPNPLDVVFFANSGSEANDLAWRIARTVTGRNGAIVTANAYHGSTDLTMATSPEELAVLGRTTPDWVTTIAVPAILDHSTLEDPLRLLAEAGHSPAFLAIDTVLSSDGVYDPSTALPELSALVREAGGLFVADEVQAGFGRVGEPFWGFAASGATPDIVTLGKPMGNGHPVAAVVTSREIADRFSAGGYYFSTFGGNPVSAAAGMAVLDVVDSEGLAAQADAVGAYMAAAIVGIGHEAIAAVRRRGLFLGIELTDLDGRPNGTLAATIVDDMRERQILIGRTGPGGTVLKIRPPLVFTREHADLVIEALTAALGSTS